MRSSAIQRSRSIGSITRVIYDRAQTVVVKRPETTTNALDEQTTDVDEHTEDIWLHGEQTRSSAVRGGERQEGSLNGLAVADDTVDLQHNDRVDFGGTEYEVDTVVGKPIDGIADGNESPDTDYWRITFTRRYAQ